MLKSQSKSSKEKSDGFLARYGVKPDSPVQDMKRRIDHHHPRTQPLLLNPLLSHLPALSSALFPHTQRSSSSSSRVAAQRCEIVAVYLSSIQVGLRACLKRNARAQWRRQAVCRIPVELLYPVQVPPSSAATYTRIKCIKPFASTVLLLLQLLCCASIACSYDDHICQYQAIAAAALRCLLHLCHWYAAYFTCFCVHFVSQHLNIV